MSAAKRAREPLAYALKELRDQAERWKTSTHLAGLNELARTSETSRRILNEMSNATAIKLLRLEREALDGEQ